MASILVVDDYPVTLRILRVQLQAQGHTVTTVTSGAEALQAVEEMQFDMALLDIAMPKMDGIELLKRLRATERFGERPVIMLTASVLDEYRRIARDAGATAFLTKPVSSWELLQTVDRCLLQHVGSDYGD